MKSNARILICSITLLVGQAANSQTTNCATLKTIAGNTCDTLSVNLDLSKCGGSTYEKAQIDSCSASKFQVSAAFGSNVYSMSGNSKVWGEKTVWDSSTFKFSEKTVALKTPEKKVVRKTANVDQKIAQASPAQPVVQTTPGSQTPAPLPSPSASPVASATPLPSPTPAQQAAAPFVPTLNFNGDIRLRGEEIYNENPSSGKDAHYNQLRLRARAGAKA